MACATSLSAPRTDREDAGRSLREELDRWWAAGQDASMWWRDDDACDDAGAIGELRRVLDRHHVHPLLAVIPAPLTAQLVTAVNGWDEAWVAAHGYSHRNWSPDGSKKMELRDDRPKDAIAGELRDALSRVRAAFPDQWLPVMVPPWNRIGDGVITMLPCLGYRGLSIHGPRPCRSSAHGLAMCNVHVDLMTRGEGADTRRGRDIGSIMREVATHLRARREGRVDRQEPTGIMSHHLVHDATAWTTIADLLADLARHPAVVWARPADLFGAGA